MEITTTDYNTSERSLSNLYGSIMHTSLNKISSDNVDLEIENNILREQCEDLNSYKDAYYSLDVGTQKLIDKLIEEKNKKREKEKVQNNIINNIRIINNELQKCIFMCESNMKIIGDNEELCDKYERLKRAYDLLRD